MGNLGSRILFIATIIGLAAGIRMDLLKVFDFWNIVILGAGIIAINFSVWHDTWALQHINRWIPAEGTRSTTRNYSYLVIGVGFALLACYSLGRSTSQAQLLEENRELRQRLETDPEDASNKYVCTYDIFELLEGVGKIGVLIEFGVLIVPTEIIGVSVSGNNEIVYFDQWLGRPGLTHKQMEIKGSFGTTLHLVENNRGLQVLHRWENITKEQSYYLYMESNSPDFSIGLPGFLASHISLGLKGDAQREKRLAWTECPN